MKQKLWLDIGRYAGYLRKSSTLSSDRTIRNLKVRALGPINIITKWTDTVTWQDRLVSSNWKSTYQLENQSLELSQLSVGEEEKLEIPEQNLNLNVDAKSKSINIANVSLQGKLEGNELQINASGGLHLEKCRSVDLKVDVDGEMVANKSIEAKGGSLKANQISIKKLMGDAWAINAKSKVSIGAGYVSKLQVQCDSFSARQLSVKQLRMSAENSISIHFEDISQLSPESVISSQNGNVEIVIPSEAQVFFSVLAAEVKVIGGNFVGVPSSRTKNSSTFNFKSLPREERSRKSLTGKINLNHSLDMDEIDGSNRKHMPSTVVNVSCPEGCLSVRSLSWRERTMLFLEEKDS